MNEYTYTYIAKEWADASPCEEGDHDECYDEACFCACHDLEWIDAA